MTGVPFLDGIVAALLPALGTVAVLLIGARWAASIVSPTRGVDPE